MLDLFWRSRVVECYAWNPSQVRLGFGRDRTDGAAAERLRSKVLLRLSVRSSAAFSLSLRSVDTGGLLFEGLVVIVELLCAPFSCHRFCAIL